MADSFSSVDFDTATSATASSEPAAAETVAAVPDAAQTATTESQTDPAATPQATVATTEKPKGPIPFDVHHTALENARVKAIEEYKAKVGWAESVDRAAVEEAARLGDLYQRDRPGYIRQILAEALTDAELAPLVRSEAARVLAGARGQQAQPSTEIEPDIPVMDETGRVVNHAFSAEKVKALVDRAVAHALAPVNERFTKEDTATAHREQLQQIETESTRIFSTVSKLPHYETHKAEIAKALAVLPDSLDTREAALLAYVNVVIPNLSKTERISVLKDINQKTSAATVSPSGGTTSVGKPDADKSWEDLFAEKAAAAGL